MPAQREGQQALDALGTRLHPVVESALARARVPGCSIAVVDADGPVWARGFGYGDLRSRRLATAETVFPLFSGTKLFTATAVLQLEAGGLLDLTDPVERFLPEAGDAAPVTLLQLLSHQSGLKDTLRGFLAVCLPPDPLPGTSEALAAYRLVASRPPGERVEYRNVNYAILGEIIGRVSELPYREYLRREVLGPLGMSADFGYRSDQGAAATGYMGRFDPMRLVLRVLFPALGSRLYGARVGKLVEMREYALATSSIGGLVTTMPDLGRFLQAQLAGGGAVLAKEATRRMQTQVAAGAAGVESRVGVGLGWKIGRAGQRPFLNHEGGGAGFATELRIYPETGIGIALGVNAMRMPASMRLAHRICEHIVEAVEGSST